MQKSAATAALTWALVVAAEAWGKRLGFQSHDAHCWSFGSSVGFVSSTGFVASQGHMVRELGAIIRNQIPSGRASLLDSYGEILLRAWRECTAASLLAVEDLIQVRSSWKVPLREVREQEPQMPPLTSAPER